ncbi:MAG: hypothetical protein N2043_00915 [Ignavibacterium sp.]|nr:hypothetical protein [Ignavibacterium sp.]
MNSDDLIRLMTFRKNKVELKPIFVTKVNETFILAVYQGAISKYDILIKYRQKNNNKWSNIRTPKHIHWAVDILIKMHSDQNKTKEFLDFLIDIWNNTKPIKSENSRKAILNLNYLIYDIKNEIEKFEDLSKKGEYSIKFLILLARLLMLQEKTNLESAYMFKKLLDALKAGEDIFKIVSIATHTGKK